MPPTTHLALLLSLGIAPPPVFDGRPYEEARAAAEASGRLFLVDATATWCMPCKVMDRTTWTDPRVVAWVEAHAVAVQIDVDRQRQRAAALGVESMPTIVVFRDGGEFDRVVGYRDAGQLLAWLEGVREGRREIDVLREAAGDRVEDDGTVDVDARLQLARSLVRRGALDEAAEEYVWLWDHMLDWKPSMYGVRLSFMVSSMKELAARHPPAREAFAALRDRSTPAIEAGRASRDEVVDWLHLNEVVGDEAATLRWYDRARDDPGSAPLVARVARDLFELLCKHGRWKDAGRICDDPVGVLERTVRMFSNRRQPASLSPRQRQTLDRVRKRAVRREARDLYAACLAAGRPEEAAKVAEILLDSQDTAEARLALVAAALEAEEPRPQQRRWLEEAERLERGSSEKLRRDLLEALETRAE